MFDFFDRKNGVFWIALICGFYPLVFYISNNFYAVNSFGHLGYFILFFIGLSLAGFALIELFFTVKKDLRKYRSYALFISVIMITATLMSYAIKLRLQKKILAGIFVVSVLLSIKFHDRFRKLAILILIMAVLPFLNSFLKIYELNKNMPWVELSADMKDVQLKDKPNIYLIQPDGYVDESMMKGPLYKHQTNFYNWLTANDFKLYDKFRSNYPASIPSNASMFSMQHHYYGETFFSDLEIPKGREMISGQNTTNYIFQNNGYKTYFLAQDEYFQQNLKEGSFDHYNISNEEIPYFTIGDERERVLHNDLKEVLNDKPNKPKFVFVEKLLPHHIHFVKQEDQIEAERKEYIGKIEDVNLWLIETIDMISEADPNAIVIVLADHGGWVGMTSYPDMFTTTDEANIRSIFSSVAAIKWNGYLKEGYDTKLRSTVNLFRVLFANLAINDDYLEQMEDNSSYNLHMESWYRKSVYKVLDDRGETVYIQYKK
jgi:Sulfatase